MVGRGVRRMVGGGEGMGWRVLAGCSYGGEVHAKGEE